MSDERGSVTIWIALATFVMTTMVGLAVDLGGQVHAQQRAQDLAAQAARTGAEEVQPAPAIEGRFVRVDPRSARAAALEFLHSADATGTVTFVDDDTVHVVVSDSYKPRVLGFLNLGPWRVTGSAEARVVRTTGGIQR